jgi:hypothetical protein
MSISLQTLVDDARTLIAFAGLQGIPVPSDFRADIVRIQTLPASSVSPADEMRLNEIIGGLVTLVKPWTLTDIDRQFSTTPGAGLRRFWARIAAKKASIVGNVLNLFGIILLALVIALTTNFTTLNTALNDFRRINVSEYFELLQFSLDLSLVKAAREEDQRIQKETIKKLRQTDGLMISGSVALLPAIDLESSSPNWCMIVLRIYVGTKACKRVAVSASTSDADQAPDAKASKLPAYAAELGLNMTSPDQIKFAYALLNHAESLVLILGSSILPLMYGFLGATVYLMRQFAGETTAAVSGPTFGGRVALRIGLGGVAGLAIGWFWTPASSKAVSDLTSFSTTPFALAFLAGFSIELLFSILDRVIAAINPPTVRDRNSAVV